MNERRIRSRFPKPFFLAISSAEERPASIIRRADSTRSRSIAFAGDRPVSCLSAKEKSAQLLERGTGQAIEGLGLERFVEVARRQRGEAETRLSFTHVSRERAKETGTLPIVIQALEQYLNNVAC